jgi:ParB family chromosome partitioning protein
MANQLFENIKAIKANTMPSDIKMIDVDKLNSSSENYFDMNRIEELAETILGQGSVKENLIVTPLPTGDYEIISGHRRAAAVRLLLQKGENVSRFLPCLVQKYKNDEDKMLDLVLMNVSTRRLTDAELYRSFEIVSDILAKKKEAGEKFGKIRDTLAGYFNISSSKVGQMQNVQKYATPEVKAALDNGDISISTANQIARLSDKEQAEFASKANSDNIKLKDVKAKVDTNIKLPYNGNTEKVDTNVKLPNNGNAEKVDKLVIKEVYQDLLDRITERYNAEAQANYHDGILDYVPKDKTSSEMLEIILCRYALENYEDLLKTSE